nr:hypothetical protein [Tanacetum cinerariifolium]
IWTCLISAPNPAKVKTGTRPRTAYEVSLLTATANRMIDMEDTVGASESSGTPSTLEKSPLEFANEDPPQMIAKSGWAEEPSLEKEVAAIGPPVNKRRRKRGKEETEANAPPKVLRKDHAAFRPEQDLLGERASVPTGNVATIKVRGLFFARSPESGKSFSFPSVAGSPEDIYQPGWGVTEKATAKIARRDRKIQAREKEIKRLDHEIKSFWAVEAESNGLRNQTKNLKTMLEAKVDMKKAVEARNAKVAKELESLCV